MRGAPWWSFRPATASRPLIPWTFDRYRDPEGSILMPDPIQLNTVPDPIHRNADVEYHAPVHELRPETFVHDRARNRQIMRIQGVVPLPIGAEIELYDPNVRATVVGVRLLAGSAHVPVVVCLDVEVPEAYWEER